MRSTRLTFKPLISSPPKTIFRIVAKVVINIYSVAVSGSLNMQCIPLIYHLYIANWVIICYLPPILREPGNNHWIYRFTKKHTHLDDSPSRYEEEILVIRVVVGNGILVAWQPIQKLDPWDIRVPWGSWSGRLGNLNGQKWEAIVFVKIYFINTFRGLSSKWLAWLPGYIYIYIYRHVMCFFCVFLCR